MRPPANYVNYTLHISVFDASICVCAIRKQTHQQKQQQQRKLEQQVEVACDCAENADMCLSPTLVGLLV